jgi:hypothetical protein
LDPTHLVQLLAEDLTDFPVLITDAVVQVSLFAHARSDGADLVVTADDETTWLKRELFTCDAIAGELELCVRIPSLSSLVDTEISVQHGNPRAAETSETDSWNADCGGDGHRLDAVPGDRRHHREWGSGITGRTPGRCP